MSWETVSLWHMLSKFAELQQTKNTRRTYRAQFIKFIAWLSEKLGREPVMGDLTMANVLLYQEAELARVAPSTVALNVFALTAFDKAFSEQQKTPRKLEGIKRLRFSNPPRYSLTEEETKLLLRTIDVSSHDYRSARNSMGILLALYTGLRNHAILNIKINQVDLLGRRLVGVSAKGNVVRDKALCTELVSALGFYLDARENILKKWKVEDCPTLPLLLSRRGVNYRWSEKSFFTAVKKHNTHPHQLRHTYALQLLRKTKDIRLVAHALDHADIRTTMRYTERTDDEVRKATSGLYGVT